MTPSGMPSAVIVDAVRSPMGRGKTGGALSGVHPVDLLAQVLQALVERNGLDPGTVDDVLVGCVGQDRRAVGHPGPAGVCSRPAAPSTCPSVTIERKCGSGQQALDFAAQGVVAGAYDIVIAAGVESMSRVPMGSARGGRRPVRPAGRRPLRAGPRAAGRLRRTRRRQVGAHPRQLDEFAARSHARAAAAARVGRLRPARSRRSRPRTASVDGRRDDPPGLHGRQARRPDARVRAPDRTRPASPSSTGRSPRATPPSSPTAPPRCW